MESSTIVSLQSVAHSCRDLHENNNNNLNFQRKICLSHYILCGWVAGGITSGLGVILVRMGTMLSLEAGGITSGLGVILVSFTLTPCSDSSKACMSFWTWCSMASGLCSKVSKHTFIDTWTLCGSSSVLQLMLLP